MQEDGHRAHRKSHLTREVFDEVVRYVRSGVPPLVAARALGIAQDSWKAWLTWGRDEKPGPEGDPDITYVRLVHAVEKAQQECLAEDTLLARSVARGYMRKRHLKTCPLLKGEAISCTCPEERTNPDGYLLFRWLESRLPEYFLRPQKLEHSGPEGAPIQIEATARAKLGTMLQAVSARLALEDGKHADVDGDGHASGAE